MHADVDHIGVFFYVWVGLFSLSIVAQFWSYANDIYTKDAGDRLFPIIGVGMTAGSPVGAWIAERMFHAHLSPHLMLYVAAALLLSTVGLYAVVNRRARARGRPRRRRRRSAARAPSRSCSASRYIGLIAVLLILLNIVNTVGEYILSHMVVAQPPRRPRPTRRFDKNAYIGAFYGSYFLWVNVAAVVLQMFVAPRLVKRFGVAGVLFALPLIALGAYGFIAVGATLAVVRWAKTAENATDYSMMNTARQLLWLPTSREEKYKAKQAVDSFFVRLGDVTAAVVVFAGTTWLALEARGFAIVNVVFVLALAGPRVRARGARTAACPPPGPTTSLPRRVP